MDVTIYIAIHEGKFSDSSDLDKVIDHLNDRNIGQAMWVKYYPADFLFSVSLNRSNGCIS